MHKNWRTTHERIEKFISKHHFTDNNLYGKLFRQSVDLKVYHWRTVDVPQLSENIIDSLSVPLLVDVHKAIHSDPKEWDFVDSNFQFGPTWSLHWFRVEGSLSKDWPLNDAFLFWNSDTEALVFNSTGLVIQGVNSDHERFLVPVKSLIQPSEHTFVAYVQVTCSQLFGAGQNGMISAPHVHKKDYSVKTCQLRWRDPLAYQLFLDLEILHKFAENVKSFTPPYEALYAANDAVNLALTHQEDGYKKALEVTEQFFRSSSCGLYRGRHETVAMGHCHIDTAWLWRYEETRRKCARSWSTALALLEQHPTEMRFVCSQAQQLQWLKQDYPQLFQRLLLKAKEGTFVPVGATWVEMDANLPSCESFIRQFLYGQDFFKEHFGRGCEEFWLPDTFGYSAQLPQIMCLFGIHRFVTQKISWSLVNKFPHHTFFWRGIDGSQVLTHFPSGDSYCMRVNVDELIKTEENFRDKGRSNRSMFLYGYGDGGQGPTPEMLHRVKRLTDCAGLPKLTPGTPSEFFRKVECEDVKKLCTWSGELYLELHNATYTTHHQLKQLNLSSELHLMAVEMMQSLWRYHTKNGEDPHHSKLLPVDTLWQHCLLNQFHDVLPGSSIELACDDAFHLYQSVLAQCATYLKEYTTALGPLMKGKESSSSEHLMKQVIVNPTSWPMWLRLDDTDGHSKFVELPALGCSNVVQSASPPHVQQGVKCQEQGSKTFQLSNQYLRVTVNAEGSITSLALREEQNSNVFKECLNAPVRLCLYDDVPLYWDAWDVMDYHWETRMELTDTANSGFTVAEGGTKHVSHGNSSHCARVETTFEHPDNGTRIVFAVQLDSHLPYVTLELAIPVWNMSHKLLKLECPTSLTAGATTTLQGLYEIQAGFLSRPAHRNTSWDWAQHEVCSHRWLALQEFGWGVALLKEATYGGVIKDNILHLSLLRASKAPDATADCKRAPHQIRLGLYPFWGSVQTAKTTQLAHQLAWDALHLDPLRKAGQLQFAHEHETVPVHISFIRRGETSPEALQVLALVKSQVNSSRLLLRVNEIFGGHSRGTFHLLFPVTSATRVSCLHGEVLAEDKPEEVERVRLSNGGHDLELALKPFEILTVALQISQ